MKGRAAELALLRREPPPSDPGGRLPDGVRLGPGTLIENDVLLGEAAGRSSARHSVEVGARATIRRGSALYEGVRAGDRLDVGINVVVRADTSLGDDCHVSNNTIVEAGCTIGNRVWIDAHCYIARFSTIEDDVTIAPSACLADDPHPGSESHLCRRGPTIKRGAQIGLNATVLPFVTVGERSLVGAGSVVTEDVPAGMVVAGNPARVLKAVSEVTCPLDLERGAYLAYDNAPDETTSRHVARAPRQRIAAPGSADVASAGRQERTT